MKEVKRMIVNVKDMKTITITCNEKSCGASIEVKLGWLGFGDLNKCPICRKETFSDLDNLKILVDALRILSEQRCIYEFEINKD